MARLLAATLLPDDGHGSMVVNEPETEVIETPDAGPSIDDTIREQYRALTSDSKTELGEEPAATPGPSESAATPPAAEGRARGPDGKFTTAPAAGGVSASLSQESVAPATGAAVPHDAYPGSWKKDHEATWKQLPPAVREEIHRREQNFLDGLKDYKEPAAFGKALAADLMPHLDTFRKLNTTPQAVVREVMGAWSMLVNGTPQQKRDTLLQTARAYGIELAAGPASSPPNGAAPPASQPDFSPVLQRVESLEQTLQAQRAEADRLNQERVDQEIAAFGSNPKNAHFSAVREEMGRLIQAGSATTLQDAYDKAVWAHPETRAKLLAEEAASLSKRQAEEAAAARKAASANVTRRGTPPAVQKPGSMDDTIRSEFRRLTAEA